MVSSVAKTDSSCEHTHMTFYGNLQSKAQALIERFGQAVTLIQQVTSASDPVTGETTTVETVYSLHGLVLDLSTQDGGKKFADGVTIEQDYRRCIISTAAVVPAIGDRLVAGGTRYSITNVKAVNPANTDVLFECWIK